MAHTFTPEDARKGAEVANIVKAEKRAQRDARSVVVWRVVSETEDLAPATLATVLKLVERAAEQVDELDISDPLSLQRVATAAEILHKISRLASGQSTANVAHANLTDDERRAKMAELRGDTVASATTASPPPSPRDA